MNLQKIQRLECNDGDVVLLRATDVNGDQLTQLFIELAKIKRRQKSESHKQINYIVLSNEWTKLINVGIMDAKGALFEIDKLLKQLIRTADGLVNRIKVEGNSDALTQKILQNIEYVKSQRGIK